MSIFLRTKYLYVALLVTVLTVPAFAYAAPRTFVELVRTIINIVNPLAALLVSIALLLFFVNTIRYIWSAGGGEKRTLARENVMWSVIAIFVIISCWGLARVLTNTLLGTQSSYIPSPEVSAPRR